MLSTLLIRWTSEDCCENSKRSCWLTATDVDKILKMWIHKYACYKTSFNESFDHTLWFMYHRFWISISNKERRTKVIFYFVKPLFYNLTPLHRKIRRKKLILKINIPKIILDLKFWKFREENYSVFHVLRHFFQI